MSFRHRDPPESSRGHGEYETERRRSARHACDIPLRIVVVEPSAASGRRVFRVVMGRQCDASSTGVGFICPVRLPGSEVFLEVRADESTVRLEAARIVHESQTPDGRWRYGAVLTPSTDLVDRYEFD
jgi:hypothetical protein